MITDTTFTTRGDVDPRAAELLELVAAGVKLPLSIDLILWLEDRNWVVDLRTGKATQPHACTEAQPTPCGSYSAFISAHAVTPPPTRDERQGEAAAQADFERHYRWCQAEAADLEDDMEDRTFWAHGC